MRIRVTGLVARQVAAVDASSQAHQRPAFDVNLNLLRPLALIQVTQDTTVGLVADADLNAKHIRISWSSSSKSLSQVLHDRRDAKTRTHDRIHPMSLSDKIEFRFISAPRCCRRRSLSGPLQIYVGGRSYILEGCAINSEVSVRRVVVFWNDVNGLPRRAKCWRNSNMD